MGGNGKADLSRVDPLGRAVLDEYRFLRAFPGYTHESYLDEDPLTVRWLLAVDAMVNEAQEGAERRANQGGGP